MLKHNLPRLLLPVVIFISLVLQLIWSSRLLTINDMIGLTGFFLLGIFYIVLKIVNRKRGTS